MAGSNILEFTEANFDAEVMSSDKPVLVDFWAPWCAPCRAVGPTVDAIADSFAGKAKVGKVNIDEHPAIAAKFGVQSIPTIIVVKDGAVADTFVGIRDEETLSESLSNAGATA
jgi:thioredoxin 1